MQGVYQLQGKETGYVASPPLVPKDVDKNHKRPDRETQILEIGAEKPREVNVLYCTDVSWLCFLSLRQGVGEGNQCNLWRHFLLELYLSGLRVKNKQVGSEDQMLTLCPGRWDWVGAGVLCKRLYTFSH